ncbi:MAG: hypothetical protein AMJ94_06130, partial [Deltaproteobacteria bacterium SM23_61]
SNKQIVDFHGGSPFSTFLTMINVFVEYIIYMIIPVYLDHYYVTPFPQSLGEPQVLLSIAAVGLLLIMAWRSFRQSRIFFFWFGWFFISLLPVLNIVPIAILRADRYMYFPALGFFYFVSLALLKFGRGQNFCQRVLTVLTGTALVAGSYAFLTMERNKAWSDYVCIWENNIKKFPQNPLAYLYIGFAHVERGQFDRAILTFQFGLHENPKDSGLMNGLSVAYKAKGNLKKAEELLLELCRVDPKNAAAYNNLALIYWDMGDLEKARSLIQKTLDLDPKNIAARGNLGLYYYTQKQWEKAIQENEEVIRLSPGGYLEPYLNLFAVFVEMKQMAKAEEVLKKGMDYFPNSAQVLFQLGRLSYEQGKIPEAKYYLSRAHRLAPRDEPTNYFLRLVDQRVAQDRTPGKMNSFPPAPTGFMESSGAEKSGRLNL